MRFMVRSKQAVEGSLVTLGALATMFVVPFALVYVIEWGGISFEAFINGSLMGMSMPEFFRLNIAFLVFGAGTGFLIPTSVFEKDYIICRWWR